MKESEKKHFIQRYAFEVEVDSKADAKPVQDRLSALFNNRIIDILSEVLDDFDDPAYITRIDSIELDLGELSESHLEGDLLYQFERKLRSMLEDIIGEIGRKSLSDTERGRRIPLAPAKIEILEYFLENGRMPNGAEVFQQGVETMLVELVEIEEAPVVAMLVRAIKSNPLVATRMVRQFSRQTLEKLFQAAVADQVYFLRAQETEILEKVPVLTGYNTNKVREEALIAFVQYIFSDENLNFDSRTFRKEVATTMAKVLGAKVHEAFIEAAARPAKPDEEVTQLAQFKAVLEEALKEPGRTKTAHSIVEAWEYVLRKAPNDLRQVIARYAKTTAHVAELVQYLPVEAVREMVRAILAQQAPKVLEVAVAVIAARSGLGGGNLQDEKFVKQVYSSIIFSITRKERTSFTQEEVAADLKKDLQEIVTVSAELIEKWEEFEIPGAVSEAKKQVLKAEAKALEEKAATEARQKEEKVAEEQRIAAKAEEEKKAAEEQQQKGPEEEEEAVEKKAKAAEEEELTEEAKAIEEETREERIAAAKEKQAEKEAAEEQRQEETEEEEKAVEKKEKAVEEEELTEEAKAVEEKTREERIAAAKEKQAEKEAEVKAEQEAEVEEERRQEKIAEEKAKAERIGAGIEEGEERAETKAEAEAEAEKEAELAERKREEEVIDKVGPVRPSVSEETTDPEEEATAEKETPTLEERGADFAEEKTADLPDARPLAKREPRTPQLDEAEIANLHDPKAPMRPLVTAENYEDAEMESLASDEGSVEFVLYYFRYGKQPWWGNNLRQRSVEALVKRLVEESPAALTKATREMILKTPRAEYPEIVNRIINSLDDVALMRFLEKLAPEMVGFMGTVARALGVFYEAKWTETSIPAHISSPETFAWHYPVKYLFEYFSGSPRPAEMMRYALRATAHDIKEPPRDFIQEMEVLATEAIEKGERRFAPFKSMLPKPMQPLQVPEPELHPGEAEALTAAEQAFQEARTTEAAKEESAEAAEAQKAEEAAARPAEKRSETEEVREADPARPDIPVVKAEEPEVPDTVSESPAAESAETPATPATEPEIAEEPAAPELPVEKEAELPVLEIRDDEISPEIDEELPAEEAAALETPASEAEEAAAEEGLPPIKEEEAELPPLTIAEAIARAQARAKKARKAEREKKAALQPKEEAEKPEEEAPGLPAIIEEEGETIRLVRFYLEHGAIPHQEAQQFTQKAFSIFLREAFVRYERPMVLVMKAVMAKRIARMRLVNLGAEIAEETMLRINWNLGQFMQTYVQSIVQLIRSGGAPISDKQLMEHAILFVSTHKSSNFQPLTYIKELVRYMARTYSKPPQEFVKWMMRKNEEKQVPVKAALGEILEVIRVAVDRYPGKPEPKKRIEESRYGKLKVPEGEEIFIENAGMVLIWPFLLQYFIRLGLFNEDQEFKDDEAKERAVHMLQYMVADEQNAPEEKLFFNKLLVGLPIDFPLQGGIEITEAEIETTGQMLRAVCDQWSMMKGAPPEQLRQTFLLRDGTLKREGDDWSLTVDKRGYDMVLKKLPWAIGMVRLPWLEYVINVDWG